jgi:hypothetical protein
LSLLFRARIFAPAFVVCIAAMLGSARSGETALPVVEVPLLREFGALVAPKLSPPSDVASEYAAALDAAGIDPATPRFVVQVDRSPNVQVLLLWWGKHREWRLVGAAPVSTGLPGRFDHFKTPLGVFEHSVRNPDFRAEGTKNSLGIRGYGKKGIRIYDFGWVMAEKGWGDHGQMLMRLQMHATDPDRLEQRLGTAQSKGCIRIPASLNTFFDRFGVLDEDYELELASGKRMWVLPNDRTPSPWSGRYLVVMDSLAASRPLWASLESYAGVRLERAGPTSESTVADPVC